MLRVSILTLFPEFFFQALDLSILARAANSKQVQYRLLDLRKFGLGKHQVTDDRPYGGGPGMVMMIEPIDRALTSIKAKKGAKNSAIVLLSARGDRFNQIRAKRFAKLKHLVMICGHYQDVDQRVAEHLVDLEISLGDFVLTGGEPAALAITDSVVRLLPGALGNEASLEDESHAKPGLPSSPQYTRPEVYKGWTVPQILLSGHHRQILDWRRTHSTGIEDNR